MIRGLDYLLLLYFIVIKGVLSKILIIMFFMKAQTILKQTDCHLVCHILLIKPYVRFLLRTKLLISSSIFVKTCHLTHFNDLRNKLQLASTVLTRVWGKVLRKIIKISFNYKLVIGNFNFIIKRLMIDYKRLQLYYSLIIGDLHIQIK